MKNTNAPAPRIRPTQTLLRVKMCDNDIATLTPTATEW